MKIIHNTISVGADQEFRFLHMSDTHLVLVNHCDSERKQKLAEDRKQYFGSPYENAEFALDYAQKHDLFIAHTGDLIDFVSEGNLEYARRFNETIDCFMAAGNHEYSQYVGEAFEDAEYRNKSLPKVQKVFRNDIRFSVREINGVNLVAVDNSYYLFEREQLDALKRAVSMGKPVLLFLHVPLYTDELAELNETVGDGTSFLMATPDDRLKTYSEKRYIQQRADAVTWEAYEYIKNEKQIKCIFTGHVHFDFECRLNDWCKQIGCGCDTIREINVK